MLVSLELKEGRSAKDVRAGENQSGEGEFPWGKPSRQSPVARKYAVDRDRCSLNAVLAKGCLIVTHRLALECKVGQRCLPVLGDRHPGLRILNQFLLLAKIIGAGNDREKQRESTDQVEETRRARVTQSASRALR